MTTTAQSLIILFFASLTISCGSAGRLTEDIRDTGLITFSISRVHSINPDVYGFNTHTAAGPSWTDPSFMKLLSALQPGNLRYPGGTIGNYLDWQTGQYMVKDLRDPELKAPRKPLNGTTGNKILNTYRIDELKNGITATEAAPIFMLNMLTDILDNSKNMLSYAANMDLPIKYIELGNELYLSYTQGGTAPNTTGDYCKDFHYPTALSYATEAKRYITELKAIYPNALFAYNAVIDKSNETWFNSSSRTREWNSVMKSTNIGADAVVLHLYTSSASSPERLISNMLSEVSSFNTFTSSAFQGMSIWVTEYNVKCDDDEENFRNAYVGQWIHGINSLVMTMELMLLPQVELLCFHDIAADIPAATIYAQAFDIPTSQGSSQTLSVAPMTLSASGHAFTLLGKAMKGANKVARLSCSSSDKVGGVIDSIFGYMFEGTGSRSALFINFTSYSKSIDSRLNNLTAIRAKHYSAQSLTSVINSNDKLTMIDYATSDHKIILPPYSISVLSYN